MNSLFWVVITEQPKGKKDEDDKLPKVVVGPELVVARTEMAAAMKTVSGNPSVSKLDMDRVQVVVRPF